MLGQKRGGGGGGSRKFTILTVSKNMNSKLVFGCFFETLCILNIRDCKIRQLRTTTTDEHRS